MSNSQENQSNTHVNLKNNTNPNRLRSLQRTFADYLNQNQSGYREEHPLSGTLTRNIEHHREDDVYRILRRLEEKVQQLEERAMQDKQSGKVTRYRKNKRVVYIPRDPLVEKVLEKLRKSEDEPIKVTIRRVFAAAAKQVGIEINYQQKNQLQNFLQGSNTWLDF